MKVGDSWDCPYCGKNSFLKKESLMDGWQKLGEVLKCAACSAEIEKINPAVADGELQRASDRKKNALMALLGEDPEPGKIAVLQEESRFCRDCKFRVMTAFQVYCSKWDKEVDPMDDCAAYQVRET